jgi:transcriptional regulator with XRE-family HTH domain
MHIGKRIKMARVSKELTQQELAELIHKTRPLISSIEQTGHANIHTLEKICEVLDLDIEALKQDIYEPQGTYGRSSGRLEKLEQENVQLKKEIERLQELADSQKERIALLKEKIDNRKGQ